MQLTFVTDHELMVRSKIFDVCGFMHGLGPTFTAV